MHANSWDAVAVSAGLFSAPWLVGIVWLWRRRPPGTGTPAPSAGELARRRLGIR